MGMPSLRVVSLIIVALLFCSVMLNAQSDLQTDREEQKLKGAVKVFTMTTDDGDSMFRKIQRFDKHGFLTSVTNIPSDGKVSYEIWTNTYSVSNNSVLLERQRYKNDESDDEKRAIRYTYEYDENRRLKERNEGGMITQYAYDQSGRLVTEKSFRIPSFVISQKLITYFSNGRWVSTGDGDGEAYRYDTNQRLIEYIVSHQTYGTKFRYAYNNRGLMEEETKISYSQRYGETITGKTVYAYDFMGNVVQQVKLLGDGVQSHKKIYAYKYDQRRNILEIVEYDVFGNIVLKTVYTYDMFNNKTSEAVYKRNFRDVQLIKMTTFSYEYY